MAALPAKSGSEVHVPGSLLAKKGKSAMESEKRTAGGPATGVQGIGEKKGDANDGTQTRSGIAREEKTIINENNDTNP